MLDPRISEFDNNKNTVLRFYTQLKKTFIHNSIKELIDYVLKYFFFEIIIWVS